MEETNQGFIVPSQKQLEERGSGDFLPLAENSYILKIAKVTLNKTQAYANGAIVVGKMTAQWNVTFLPYAAVGDEMVDTAGGKVEPLTRRMWLNLSLNSYGFKKDGTPSILRSFMANVLGNNVTEQLVAKNYVVIDGNGDFVADEAKRKECSTGDVNGYTVGADLTEKECSTGDVNGYTVGADLTEFEGKYIRATVSLLKNKKDVLVNKVTGFMKLPTTFQPDLQIETEAMNKFNEGFDRRLIDMENQGTSMVLYTKDGARKRSEPVYSNVVNEEIVKIEDIQF